MEEGEVEEGEGPDEEADLKRGEDSSRGVW